MSPPSGQEAPTNDINPSKVVAGRVTNTNSTTFSQRHEHVTIHAIDLLFPWKDYGLALGSDWDLIRAPPVGVASRVGFFSHRWSVHFLFRGPARPFLHLRHRRPFCTAVSASCNIGVACSTNASVACPWSSRTVGRACSHNAAFAESFADSKPSAPIRNGTIVGTFPFHSIIACPVRLGLSERA